LGTETGAGLGAGRAPDAATADAQPILALEQLVAGYGKLRVLDGTSFEVPRGRITTVIGPNGAGKSTVFKAVFGLLHIQSGRVRFDGRDSTRSGPRRLLELGMSYVPQGRNIFPELSVLHNLELGATAAPAGVDVAARVEAVMERFPMLRQRARDQASTLSGGQQKLLEIGRALLLQPKLMLIDEPSIGLSPLLVRETFEILQDLRARGMSILMVEQNARSALQISDHAIVLELGRTRITGPADAMLADPRVGQLFLGAGLGSTPEEAAPSGARA
jgi:branched-chain amino acid transport system ATP-binding protein